MSLQIKDHNGQNTVNIGGEDVASQDISTVNTDVLAEDLLILWEFYLKKEALCFSDHFFELGGQSLEGLQLIVHINRKYSVFLSLNDLFDNPSVSMMAQYILDLLSESIEYEYFHENLYSHTIKTSSKLPLASHIQRQIRLSCDSESFRKHVCQGYITLKGPLSISKLKEGIDHFVQTNDVFSAQIQIDVTKNSWVEFDQASHNYIFELELLEHAQEDKEKTFQELLKVQKTFTSDEYLQSPYHFAIVNFDNDEKRVIFSGNAYLFDEFTLEVMLKQLNDFVFMNSMISTSRSVHERYEMYLSRMQHDEVLLKQSENNAYWYDLLKVKMLEWESHNPQHQSSRVDQADFEVKELALSIDVLQILSKRAAENHSSLFIVLLSIYSFVLNRYLNQIPLIKICDDFNRALLGKSDQVLPLLLPINEKDTFKNFLLQVKEKLLSALEFRLFDFETILSSDGDSIELHQLFTSSLKYYDEREGLKNLGDDNVEVHSFNYPLIESNFEWRIRVSNEGVSSQLCYQQRDFEEEWINQFVASLETVINAVSLDLNQPLYLLPLLGPDQQEWLQKQHWQNYRPFDLTKNVVDLVFQQSRRVKDATAVLFEGVEDEGYTFTDLCQLVSGVSNFLVEKGVSKNDVVAIGLEKNELLPICLLGVIDAGATLLCIDLQMDPVDIEYQLEHSGANYFVAKGRPSLFEYFTPKIPILELPPLAYFMMSNHKRIKQAAEVVALVYEERPDNQKPIAVSLPQYSLSNTIQSLQYKFKLSDKDRLLVTSELGELSFLIEMILPLVSGSSVLVKSLEPFGMKNRAQLIDIAIYDHGISFISAAPSLWAELRDEGWRGSSTLTALIDMGYRNLLPSSSVGDDEPLLDFLLQRVSSLWLTYGAVESTGIALIEKIEPISRYGSGGNESHRSIVQFSQSLDNVHAYVLNEYGNPVPPGVPGHLFIGGRGITNGYFHRDILTEEEFLFDPWAVGGRMFRTQQPAKILPSGAIELLEAQPAFFMKGKPLLPRNDTEFYLADLWMSLLDIDRVERTNNFMSLGGFPDQAMKFIETIQAEMSVSITLNMVYRQSLEELASDIDLCLSSL